MMIMGMKIYTVNNFIENWKSFWLSTQDLGKNWLKWATYAYCNMFQPNLAIETNNLKWESTKPNTP